MRCMHAMQWSAESFDVISIKHGNVIGHLANEVYADADINANVDAVTDADIDADIDKDIPYYLL